MCAASGELQQIQVFVRVCMSVSNVEETGEINTR